MPQQTKIFRVFVSSTFTDMKKERSILQKEVFPKLEKYCEVNGARFQAVDLRWGVNEDSALNQKTVEICLNEIRRCQKLSPRPNFLILLGDRYGWQPVPAIIPESEMESIRRLLQSNTRKLVEEWYKLDENAVPAEYLLQPWGERFSEYKGWEMIENQLRKALREAAIQANLSADALMKYSTSATHQEIIAGALNSISDVMDPKSHVLAFSRTILNLPSDEKAGDYVDLVGGKRDPYCQKQLARLREELMDMLQYYQATWDQGDIKLDNEQKFIDDTLEQMKSMIGSELAKIVDEEEIGQEIRYHREFMDTLTVQFIGREDSLKRILKYLDNKDSKQIFSLIGASGSGKTCVMARAISEVRKRDYILIYRFLGANAKSSNIVSMLTSVCGQIAREYGVELESLLNESQKGKHLDINIMMGLFKNCLALAKVNKPLVLFLDALDQVSETDNALSLNWLPTELPPHVHFIVSSVPELEDKLTHTEVYHLPLMRRATGKDLLDVWLKMQGRTLRRKQKREVLGKFNKTRLPLFLRIAFERARKWHSYDPSAKIAYSIPDLIEQYFAELEREHSQPLVSKAVGYILSGKDKGLTEDEILDILWFDKEYRQYFLKNSHPDHRKEVEDADKLPVVVWSRLFLDLAPYLTERDSYGERIIGFYHRQFNEILRNKYLKDEIPAHRKLGEYFSSLPLFFDGENQKQPNVRKCVEQPWQMTQGEMWNEVTDTLCDLDFIQAKACAKMTFELVHEINSVLKVIPENSENITREREWQVRMENYACNLISYSKNKTKILKVPDSVKSSPQEKTEAEIERIKKKYQRLDRLNAFIQFLGIEAANLQTHAREFPHFTVQQAWNHAADGPVEDAARQQPESVLGLLLLKTEMSRPAWNPHPVMIKQLPGHTEAVYAVDITPDCTRAVSGSGDNTLLVWDLVTGLLLRRLVGHKGPVNTVVVISDGSRAVSGSDDKTLIVWNLDTGKPMHRLKGHTNGVISLSATPDCCRAVSVSHDQTMIVWDLEKGKVLSVFKLNGFEEVEANKVLKKEREKEREREDEARIERQREMGGRIPLINRGIKDLVLFDKAQKVKYVETVGVTPDGCRAVSGSRDNSVIIWDLKTGRSLRTLYGHTDAVNAVALTPDGHRVVSGSSDHTIILWDLLTGKLLHRFEGHADTVNAVAVTPDGGKAVSASEDNILIVWDLEAGKILLRLEGHTGSVYDVSVTADGRRAISASEDKTLIVWDLETDMYLPGIKDPSDSVCIAREGGRIAVSGSSDYSLLFWDLKTGKLLHRLKGHTDTVNNVTVTPDSLRAVSVSMDNTLIVWDLEAGKLFRKIKVNSDHLRSMNVTTDCRRAVLWYYNDTLIVWDLEMGKILSTLEGIGGFSFRHIMEVTRDGRMAVSVFKEKTLIISDLETGKILHRLEGQSDVINYIAVTPDNCKALSGASDHTLSLWDLEAGKLLHRFEGHSDFVDKIVVTLDGCRAISTSGDNMMIVWDLETGRLLHKLDGRISYIKAPEITSNGRWIVSGGQFDGILLIWDLETGKLLHKLDAKLGSDFIVTPDGHKALSKTRENTILVWDVETEKLLHTLIGHRGRIQTVIVTPDGSRAVSGGDDNTLIVWDLERGRKIACFPSRSSVNYSVIGAGIVVGGYAGGDGFILHTNREVLDFSK